MLGDFFTIMAGTWLVPAVGFAILLPYMKPVARLPLSWGVGAVIVSSLIIVWTIWSWNGLGRADVLALCLAATASLGLGLMILSKSSLADMWPFLALTLCLAAMGMTLPLQSMTYETALGKLHEISGRSLPDEVDYYNPRHQEEWRAYGFGDMVPGISEDYEVAASSELAKSSHRGLDLQLALVGGLSFWLTLAVLVAWRMREPTADPGNAALLTA
jgi:hypothetical protein